MGDESKTGTEAGASDPGTAEGQSSDQTAEPQDRSKQLEDRLAAKGREAKAEKARAEAAEAKLAALQEERDELWYKHQATDAEKEQYRAARDQAKAKKDDPEKINLANENSLLKAIAQEVNPAAKKALTKMFEKAEKTGRYPDAAAVAALRESFEDDESSEGDEPDEKKEPPKVSATRGSQAHPQGVDERIAQTQKDIRVGKATTADLYALFQERDAQRAAARRG